MLNIKIKRKQKLGNLLFKEKVTLKHLKHVKFFNAKTCLYDINYADIRKRLKHLSGFLESLYSRSVSQVLGSI